VAPSIPVSLGAIDDLVGSPIERVVVAADYEGFHNSVGLQNLLEVWPVVHQTWPDVQLHLYGRGTPPPIHTEGVSIKGWAENLIDVYTGPTVVFIPNIDGSGVPNKLVEAVAARRPVIVHESLLGLLQPKSDWVFPYSNLESLQEQLRNAIACHPSAPPAPAMQMSTGLSGEALTVLRRSPIN
jgi:glycosyltransferase involved in cell wall biosynthesis